MAPVQDLRRLVDGLSLVVFEAAKRSQTLEAARTGSVENLISHILKRAVVFSTDLSGITSGRLRQYSGPRTKESSVVYFTDVSEATALEPDRAEMTPPVHSRSGGYDEVVQSSEVLAKRIGVGVTSLGELKDDGAGNDGELVGNRGDDPRSEREIVDLKEKSEPARGEQQLSVLKEKSEPAPVKRRRPRERRVPSTPIGRALGFASLGAGLAWGTIQESTKRLVFGTPNSDEKKSVVSPFLSDQNAERLALALCRMRGAALKLGQMLSIQDESLVPAPILSALEIVRQGADVMPRSQLNAVLDTELGPEWISKLKSFDYEPLAAASIGQVHRAVMKDGLEVAMKIQYPGVADSIDSDIENVRRLLSYTNLIPEGLFLDRAIKVAKEELSRECDYELESINQKRFRELLYRTEGFYVPLVIDSISSKKVLTTELVAGKSLSSKKFLC